MLLRRLLVMLSPLLLLSSCGSSSAGENPVSGQAPFRIEEAARFEEPWAIAFIPDTSLALVTGKKGQLLLWENGGSVRDVAGTPAVDYGGQGGFGDVAVSPRFAEDGLVYLSWAEAGPGDTRGAVVGRARLDLAEAPRLGPVEVILRQDKVSGRGHYSHRLAFSPDGSSLYISSGDRQKMTPAQDDASNLGKVVRLDRSAPERVQTFSMGHRNILGFAFDGSGRLWGVEHGAAGGDELNRIEEGRNYGWPSVSEGDHYDGTRIARHATQPEFAPPALSWTPVIAPGDMTFYSGELFSGWRGDLLIAAMKPGAIVRVRIEGDRAREVARYPMDNRIRAIAEGPDGAIWVLEDGRQLRSSRLLRLTPAAP